MPYLLAALAFAPLSGFLWFIYLQRKKTPRIVRESIPGLSLRLSHSGGLIDTLTLPAGRISCGLSPDYDIDLTKYVKAGRTTGKAPVEELSFQLADGRLAVTAHIKVMMNGVERTTGSIPVNGSLLFKNCRFTFLGQTELQQERSVHPVASDLRKLAALPVTASMATVIVLAFGLTDPGVLAYFKRVAPRPVIVVEQQVEAVEPIATLPEVAPEVASPAPSSPAPSSPSTTPAINPGTAPVKRPVVVPLRSAVRPEPIKPVPERRATPVVVDPAPSPVKPPVVVPSRSAVRPEPIKPVPERSPALATARPESVVEPKPTAMPKPTPLPKPTAMPKPTPLPESRPTPAHYPAPRMVGPREAIPEERVDVLFIHAHPDDESIDFGTLIALCREAGLTTAMVLLTDGEGGIYQQDYKGPRDNMVSTRIQEAAKAMQVLGTSLYIRLGLRNSPYNSLLEERSVQEVLQLWGGDAVVARLAGIINTLGPKVVVSPEGPSFAREHFEHETTGVLTLMALQQLRLAGGHVPEAHLVSIDPRQKDAYSGLIAFPRQQVMEKQRRALLSHATQADATYFGVQIIEKYSEEYYLIVYWDIVEHFTRFFRLVSAYRSPTPGLDETSIAFKTGYRMVP